MNPDVRALYTTTASIRQRLANSSAGCWPRSTLALHATLYDGIRATTSGTGHTALLPVVNSGADPPVLPSYVSCFAHVSFNRRRLGMRPCKSLCNPTSSTRQKASCVASVSSQASGAKRPFSTTRNGLNTAVRVRLYAHWWCAERPSWPRIWQCN